MHLVTEKHVTTFRREIIFFFWNLFVLILFSTVCCLVDSRAVIFNLLKVMEQEVQKGVKKRKAGNANSKFKKSRKPKKLRREGFGADDVRVKKMDKRMKKFLQKKARDYNSDNEDDGDVEKEKVLREKKGLVAVKDVRKDGLGVDFSDDEEDGGEDNGEQNEVSEDEDGNIQPGILIFSEGCRAYRLAFKKITKKTASTDDDILVSVLDLVFDL